MAKVRESGMPSEKMWNDFFSPLQVLETLGLARHDRVIVDFGCGYGTFSVPAAQLTGGVIHALDIDTDMLSMTQTKSRELTRGMVTPHAVDFMAKPIALPDGSADYVMLFNILHAENPLYLLNESHRLLNPQGRVGVMHWNHDAETPRGPPMNIRPTPEQVQQWMKNAGFTVSDLIELPPYHYGFIGSIDFE